MIRTNPSREKLNTRIFRAVHRRNLIYNTCWEDPALDRFVGLDRRAASKVLYTQRF